MRPFLLGIVLLVATAFSLFSTPLVSAPISTSVRYTTSGNVTLSLGILSPTFDNLPFPNTRNLTVIVSNCSTSIGSTTCLSLTGANVTANVATPDSNVTLNFTDQGDGNYTHFFLFHTAGNFTFNITANHSLVGATSLLKTVFVNSSISFNPNLTVIANVTILNGSLLNAYNMTCFFNETLSVNITFFSGASFIFSLSFIENKTRSAVLTEGGIFVSPESALINITSINGSENKATGVLRENDLGFTGKDQQMFLFMNNSQVRINLSLYQNELRPFGIIANDSLLVSPRNASLGNFSYSSARRAFNFSATGSGSQEVLIYVGDKGEPANVTAGSALLTSSNWSFNSAEKTLKFNSSFSTVTFLVSWSPPSQPSPEPSPSPSAGGGGGGGGSGGTGGAAGPPAPSQAVPTPAPFSVSPDLFKFKLTAGSFARELLTIRNGPAPLDFTLENRLDEFLIIEENSFPLAANTVRNILLFFFAPEDAKADTYIGSIQVNGGGSTINIPIVIDLKPSGALLDARVKVLNEEKRVAPDGKLQTEISFFNLGSERPRVDVKLTLEVADLESGGKQIVHAEALAFQTQLSVIRAVDLPASLRPGRYLIILTVDVGGEKATASDTFEVVEGKKEDQTLFYLSVAGIAFLLGGIIILIVHRHLRQEKAGGKYIEHLEKYHVEPSHLKPFIKRQKHTIKKRRKRKEKEEEAESLRSEHEEWRPSYRYIRKLGKFRKVRKEKRR